MIKFCNPNATEAVLIDGTEFYFKCISVRVKFEILTELSSMQVANEKPDDGNITQTLDNLKDILCRAIVSVCRDGNIIPFTDAFEDFQNLEDIKKIQATVLRYCSQSEEQRKNLDSSPEQPSPVSAGSAENNAEPVGEPVGTTPE